MKEKFLVSNSQILFVRNKKAIIFALPFTEWIELVAQLVEQYTFNVWALGSSPSGFTQMAVRNGGHFLLGVGYWELGVRS
jgi:hypothetical protein